MKYCWLLLVLFIIPATLYVFIVPPTQGPDETFHWRSSIAKAKYLFGEESNCSFEQTIPDHFETGKVQHHREVQMSNGRFRSASSMPESCAGTMNPKSSAWIYPNVLLLKVLNADAKTSAESSVEVFYLARLSGLVLVLLSLVRLLVIGEESVKAAFILIMAVLLTPIGIAQSAIVSTDPIIFSFTIFVLINTIYLDKITVFDQLLLFLTGASALFVKPILFFEFAPLFLIIFGRIFLSKKIHFDRPVPPQKLYTTLISCFILFAIAVKGYLTFGDLTVTLRIQGIDPDYVNQLLTSPPFLGWKVLAETLVIFLQPANYMGPLGSFDIDVSAMTIKSYYVVSTIALTVSSLHLMFSFREMSLKRAFDLKRILFFGLFIVTGLVIAILSMIGMYLYWTNPARANFAVDGVQSRYFIPVFILAFGGILYLTRPDTNEKKHTPPILAVKYFEILAFISTAIFGLRMTTGLALSALQRFW